MIKNSRLICFSAILAFGFFLISTVYAIQPDAPYLKFQKKHQAKWAEQNKQVENKLVALQKKFGKKPNIIYILSDDVGWGELGVYGMGKMRGTPTPNLDNMAKQGMKFLQGYAEPSCTPSRIAIMTGRHPVRTGVQGVIWPGQKQGLSPDEVTVAELLKKAGYKTAMFGKWHLGDAPKFSPENQGFDYSYYGLYNGAAFAWPDTKKHYKADTVSGNAFFFDYPDDYTDRYGIDIVGIYEGAPGQQRKEMMKISAAGMDQMERNSAKKIVQMIKDNANAEKPFFIYWATYANQVAGSPPEMRHSKGVDSRNNQAAQMALHDKHVKQILDTLRQEGIDENTLVVWFSDNGPMYAFYPNSGYTWLRGGKGEVYEGGVRVPAIARWPGMIEAGQDPLDFMHLTDLYTTAARLGGVSKHIPSDRITDGIDQTALLLQGEGNGRREYIMLYNGDHLAAVRLNEYKMVLTGPTGGSIPEMEMYNIMRDPAEKFGHVYPYLFMISPFQMMIEDHMQMNKKFPHRKLSH